MTLSDAGCSQSNLEGATGKRCYELSDPLPNSPSHKRQKSRALYSDDLHLIDMFNHHDTAVITRSTFSDPRDDGHPLAHYEGSNLGTKGIDASDTVSDPSATKLSSTFSPSATPSPPYSHASSSTMTFDLSSFYEDNNIPPNVLPDNGLHFRQQANAVQPLAVSSMPTEISTTSEPWKTPSAYPSAQSPTHGPVNPQIAPSQAMSIAVFTTDEADQRLLASPKFTPLTLAKATADKKLTSFVDLDEVIKYQIFEEVLVKQQPIYPTYRCGMLVEGPWAPTRVMDTMDPGVSMLENIDLSLLQVNKDFNLKCSEIFYGQNEFIFDHADICRWWMKHIGPQNFSLLRTLYLIIGCGFIHPVDQGRSTFDLSQEESWHSVLCWMQNRHRLDTLYIQIKGWNDLKRARWLTSQEKEEMSFHRQGVIAVLQRFRGIETVRFFCYDCRWLKPEEMQRLELLMQQRRETVVEKKEELTLCQLISQLRQNREEEEEEERWQRGQWPVDYGY